MFGLRTELFFHWKQQPRDVNMLSVVCLFTNHIATSSENKWDILHKSYSCTYNLKYSQLSPQEWKSFVCLNQQNDQINKLLRKYHSRFVSNHKTRMCSKYYFQGVFEKLQNAFNWYSFIWTCKDISLSSLFAQTHNNIFSVIKIFSRSCTALSINGHIRIEIYGYNLKKKKNN